MTSQHKPMAASRLVVVGAVRNGATESFVVDLRCFSPKYFLYPYGFIQVVVLSMVCANMNYLSSGSFCL